jgi:valyl-tRNA synthetase
VLLEEYSDRDLAFADNNALLLSRVGRVESVRPLAPDEEAPQAAIALLGSMRILVPMAGLIDVEAEIDRLEKQRDKVSSELGRSNAKLGNEKFVNNAPEAVVTQERQRVVEFEQQIVQLDEQLARLRASS